MDEQTLTCDDCGYTEVVVVEDDEADNTVTCPNCGGEEN